MGSNEYGKCEICGKETQLDRTYFYYPINCKCCGKEHFEMIRHCSDCEPSWPLAISPRLVDYVGRTYKTVITNIKPHRIRGVTIHISLRRK